MNEEQTQNELANRIEALEDEVRLLKILCRGLAERIQTHADILVEYER
jgi:hypothetical protein